MDLKQAKQLNIPVSPGCYRFKNGRGKIIYIGKAANLKSRVVSYWQKSANHTPAKSAMMKEIAKVDWIETDTEIEAFLLEANLIKKHQPEYNIVLRDDKRFVYIKISTEDEIPGVFVTRKIDKSGRYFGPFTSTQAVREVVKTIRRIWPYCTERKVKDKPCFYYQINRCTGVCGGKIDIADYKKQIVKPITMFLEGKKRQVVKDLEAAEKSIENRKQKTVPPQRDPAQPFKMVGSGGNDRNEAEELDYQIKRIRLQLLNINKILAHADILGVAEKYAADVVELAKVLGLPRVPHRIEGYDISNIFGADAVGSMVVFAEGEPDKSQYRKFKIRIGQGKANDTGMLKEVLERRLKRSGIEIGNSKSETRENKPGVWPLPDLIIIDGGKGQLNTAERAIKKAGLDIPVLAVSKGAGLRGANAPDKVFFPGQAKPLELPLASPAMHIIKRVRDEAHRFAVKYHQLLRKKKLFGK